MAIAIILDREPTVKGSDIVWNNIIEDKSDEVVYKKAVGARAKRYELELKSAGVNYYHEVITIAELDKPLCKKFMGWRQFNIRQGHKLAEKVHIFIF